jgi:hypothetical protein
MREEEQVPEESQPRYAVERWLREAFPNAVKPQPSGVSVDARLYFREKDGGRLWAGLALLDGNGGRVANMPLDEPDALPWILEILCELGFTTAPRLRTKPLGSD